MGQTITVRMPKELATWLEAKSIRTGLSTGEIVRQNLERARSEDGKKIMRLAGIVRGARDLSTRQGFQ